MPGMPRPPARVAVVAALALAGGARADEPPPHRHEPPRRRPALTPDMLQLLQPGGGLSGPPESLLDMLDEDGTVRHPPDKVRMADGSTATLPRHLIRPDGSLAGPSFELLQQASSLFHGMQSDKDTLDTAQAFSPEAVSVLMSMANRYKSNAMLGLSGAGERAGGGAHQAGGDAPRGS